MERNIQTSLVLLEMERDAGLSHGGASFLNERLFKLSDYYTPFACKNCGIIGTVNPGQGQQKKYECQSCHSTSVSKVKIPYAFKLLNQELMAMNVAPRLKFD